MTKISCFCTFVIKKSRAFVFLFFPWHFGASLGNVATFLFLGRLIFDSLKIFQR